MYLCKQVCAYAFKHIIYINVDIQPSPGASRIWQLSWEGRASTLNSMYIFGDDDDEEDDDEDEFKGI